MNEKMKKLENQILDAMIEKVKGRGKMRFENLQVAMEKENITVKKLAECVGVNTEKMLEKLEGKEEFTLIECFTITRELFDDYSIDYLFGEGQVKTFY